MKTLHTALAVATALVTAGVAHAEVTNANYTARAGVGDPTVTQPSPNLGGQNLPPPSPGSVSYTASSTDINALPTRLASFGTASADVGNDPTPHVDAFAQSYGQYVGNSAATLAMTLQGYVGTNGGGVTSIPVFIQGHVLSSILGATARADASLGISSYSNPENPFDHHVFDYFCTANNGNCIDRDFLYEFDLDAAGLVPGSFQATVVFSVNAQNVYFGDPTALSNAVVTAHANIDPIFYIDPTFLAAHPGTTLIPNGSFLFDTPPGGPPPGGVPEPASWALMIAGFGLAGAALRRRRAAIAA